MDEEPALLQPVGAGRVAEVAPRVPGPSFTVEVTFPDGGAVTFLARRDAFLLDEARRAGLSLPSLCEQGWCTRCAARLESGEVDQSSSLRYFEADRRAGFVLLCTARPRSHLRLRSHQHQAMVDRRVALGLPVPRG